MSVEAGLRTAGQDDQRTASKVGGVMPGPPYDPQTGAALVRAMEAHARWSGFCWGFLAGGGLVMVAWGVVLALLVVL